MKAQSIAIDQCTHSTSEKFFEMLNHLESEELSGKTHSEVEAYLETEGRELLRSMLQDHLDQRGTGRVGESVHGSDGVVRTHKRDWEIGYQSVFGEVHVKRTGYGQRGTRSLFPLDAQLNLPASSYSHRLQKRVVRKVVKDSFEGVAKDIQEETSVRIGKRQIEEIVCAAARDFDAFYAQDCPEEIRKQVHSKPILVLTFDGKGVVMRKGGLREETRKKAEAETRKPPRGLTRKDKANRKRMATVAGIYHVDRHIRRPKTVARQFAPLRLVAKRRKSAPKPVAKKLWASLEKPMKTVIEGGFEEARRRDPKHKAEWVVLVDGDLTQIDYIETAAQKYGVMPVIILDIMHVLEYIWKAANAFFDSDDPQAFPWVADKIGQLLEGQARVVSRSLRRSATIKKLSTKQSEPIDQCATYLTNHAPYLDYPRYLAKGYPIASGVIEGACRHLVKDRMELTGARWGLEGGEAVLKLRALYINGHLDAYWDFYEKQEYLRNHQVKFSQAPKQRPILRLILGGK